MKLKFVQKQFLAQWLKFLIGNPQAIIPALAIATSIVFYIVVIKFENYDWYSASAYIKCLTKFNSNSSIQMWNDDGVLSQLQCSDVLTQPIFFDALMQIIVFILKIICSLILTTITILTIFFIVSKVTQLIRNINDDRE